MENTKKINVEGLVTALNNAKPGDVVKLKDHEIPQVSLGRLSEILDAYEDSLDWNIDDAELYGSPSDPYERKREKLQMYIETETEALGAEEVRENLKFYADVTDEEIEALGIKI